MQNLGRSCIHCILRSLVILLTVVAAGSPLEKTIFEARGSCKGKKGSLRSEDLTVLDFTVGSSTIRDVQKRFPKVKPVKLTQAEEAEIGVCIKNDDGVAVVFATGVMGTPDTLTAIYLSPARFVESSHLTCERVKLASKMFSSRSGIRIGATRVQISGVVHSDLPTDGPFCAAYEIASAQGPLHLSKIEKHEGFTDFTGAEGDMRTDRLEWVKLFGIVSN